ncbi:targeting protein for Xklp2-like isoform X2 [Physella acuta]|uniref:targeting protein for Xklp2-like isoform X2 n=1 Tax=Physella acuta TaxID=109671 RepID=UPI0027DB8711|nr:targeting protein for Xklp2-like isoform X2 [Physella acuta]
MDKKWEFDAPQFVDFTQPHEYESVYDDTWFDRHFEEDEINGLGKEGGGGNDCAKKSHRENALRILKTAGNAVRIENNKAEPMEIGEKSPSSSSKEKSARMSVAEKHNSSVSSAKLCPSPSKRQKMSEEQPETTHTSTVDKAELSSPVRRSHTPNVDKPIDSPAANTRQKTLNSSKLIHSGSRNGSPRKRMAGSNSPVIRQQGTSSGQKAVRRSPRKLVKSPGQSHNSTAQGFALRRSQSLKVKSMSKSNSMGTLAKAEASNAAKGKLSDQNSGSMLNLNSKVKTSEEIELERIAALKKEMAKTRKLAQESYKKAMTAQGYVPIRSNQPSTLPLGFHFKTDERIKAPDGQVCEQRVKDFAKSLREALPQSALPTKPTIQGLTKPKPFKLHTQKSTGSLVQPQKYESMAERVSAFHNKTPDRFRSRPNASKERSRSATKSNTSGSGHRLRSQSPKLTVPKTPNLTTRGRSRPVHALTTEEKEMLEFDEHQKQQFKAHPVNHKIFEVPNIGVPKVTPKPTTVAEEFSFHHKKSESVGDIRGAGAEEEEKYEFHARPVNPKILQGTVGVKPVEPQAITIPESPAFALKNRVRIPIEVPKQDDSKNAIKVNPVPYTGIPFKPRLAHHRTVPEPFTVDERSREMLSRKEQKIQQILEEERKAREFHAQDLPSDSPDTLPPKQTRPPTQPEPFHLEADERGQKYKEQFKAKIEEEERAAREAAQFKARPNDVIHKEPFQAQKSSKPLTEINGFALNTDQRASQREVFDQHIKAREAEIEALKRQREERIEQEEKAAVARLRQEAVHKASGIKKYKAVVVKPSDKPLTEAQSPRFSQRIRSKYESTDV